MHHLVAVHCRAPRDGCGAVLALFRVDGPKAAATLSKTKGDSIDSCAIDSPPTSRVTNFTPTGADPVTASA